MSRRSRLITWSGIFLFFGIFVLALQACTPLTLPAIIGTYVSNEAASSLYDVDENCEPTTPLLEPTWDVVFHLNQEGSQVSGDALLQDLLVGAEDFAVIMSGTNPAGGQDVYFGGHVCNLFERHILCCPEQWWLWRDLGAFGLPSPTPPAG